MNKYDEGSVLFKVLADPVRLQIVDMLAQGEMCACDLLQNLPISQPTLSHHMKALRASGLVSVRKQATWMHYSLSLDDVARLWQIIDTLVSSEDRLDPQDIRIDLTCCPPDCVDLTCCPPDISQGKLTHMKQAGDTAHEI